MMAIPADPMNDSRAPFATKWEESRGRLHPEQPSAIRTPYQRDRDRIIHSAAFRRLMHKTQVFVAPETDHFRTRLTHSLEVSQIARSMARTLHVDEDLTEAVALSHDLGHPPFGHSGEDALDEMMRPYGGFDHNDQALRVVVLLEARYPTHDGLNLTWETLEGLVKHNGPLLSVAGGPETLPPTIAAYNTLHDLDLSAYAGLEAQFAALADDIAYNHHDMDDGLRSGLFSLADVSGAVPHVGETFARVQEDYPGIDMPRLIGEGVRRLIGDMVGDVVAETESRLQKLCPARVRDIRLAGQPMVAFSPAMREREKALKGFLFENMYRNPAVNPERDRGQSVVRILFESFMTDPEKMPDQWRDACRDETEQDRARIVSDYIAGMTDRYATRQVKRMFGEGKI
jgi:dGTPase